MVDYFQWAYLVITNSLDKSRFRVFGVRFKGRGSEPAVCVLGVFDRFISRGFDGLHFCRQNVV